MTRPTGRRPTGRRPNVLFIMADDHAAQAVSVYGSRLSRTPSIDRIASEGMRFDRAFCTNSLCTPARASILTGTYSHVNGVTTLDTPWDARQPTFVSALGASGYQTAVFGKWHLGHGGSHDPHGFDDWVVLPDQGEYHDPWFLTADGEVRVRGYATEVITDLALGWLDGRDSARPWCLLVHHKAPHRPWEPAPDRVGSYSRAAMAVPHGFDDDHAGQAPAAAEARMRMTDLTLEDLKAPVPDGLDEAGAVRWRWRRFVEDYLACVASVDESVSRLLDRLDARGETEDTVVVYTSDQGFFLGEHGWFDKRFMYEESLRVPLVIRYPRRVAPGSTTESMVLNVDLAPTFCELGGVDAPPLVQGRSLVPLLEGRRPDDWRTAMYYRYWMHLDSVHRVRAHFGLRTERFKLICYPDGRPVAWELFDLERDPHELRSVHDDPEYAEVRRRLTDELARQQAAVGDVVPLPVAP